MAWCFWALKWSFCYRGAYKFFWETYEWWNKNDFWWSCQFWRLLEIYTCLRRVSKYQSICFYRFYEPKRGVFLPIKSTAFCWLPGSVGYAILDCEKSTFICIVFLIGQLHCTFDAWWYWQEASSLNQLLRRFGLRHCLT